MAHALPGVLTSLLLHGASRRVARADGCRAAPFASALPAALPRDGRARVVARVTRAVSLYSFSYSRSPLRLDGGLDGGRCRAVGRLAAQSRPGASSAVDLIRSTPQLQLILANTCAYACCFSIQTPLLPSLVESLSGGADVISSYAWLMTGFSLLQLVGGLLSGPLFDSIGARSGLIVSFTASALSYGIAAVAASLPVLFLSRVPTLLQHAALASRIAVSSYATDASSKASLLGLLGLSASVGAIVGPGLGGFLSTRFSTRVALLAAMALSAASLLAVLTLMARPGAGATEAQSAPKRKPSLADIARVALQPGVPALLAAKSVLNLAVSLLFGSLALAAASEFGMTPVDLGTLLSTTSVVTLCTQAFVIEALLSRFSIAAVSNGSLLLLALSFGGLACATTVPMLAACLFPTAVATCVLTTLNTAELNQATSLADSGSINALDMSVASGIRVLTPGVIAFLLLRFGFGSIGVVGAACLFALLFVQLWDARRRDKQAAAAA